VHFNAQRDGTSEESDGSETEDGGHEGFGIEDGDEIASDDEGLFGESEDGDEDDFYGYREGVEDVVDYEY